MSEDKKLRDLAAKIDAMPFADRLRLAAELLEQNRPEMRTSAEIIYRRVADELSLERLHPESKNWRRGE